MATALLCADSARLQDPPAKPQPNPGEVRVGYMLRLSEHFEVRPKDGAPPAAPRTVLRIGLLGNDATTAAVRALVAGKQAGKITVQIVDYSATELAKGTPADCDMLYLAADVDEAARRRAIELHGKRPVVLVAEAPGFAAAGGTVQLFVFERKLRFEINATAVKDCGLRVSSSLLELSHEGPRR